MTSLRGGQALQIAERAERPRAVRRPSAVASGQPRQMLRLEDHAGARHPQRLQDVPMDVLRVWFSARRRGDLPGQDKSQIRVRPPRLGGQLRLLLRQALSDLLMGGKVVIRPVREGSFPAAWPPVVPAQWLLESDRSVKIIGERPRCSGTRGAPKKPASKELNGVGWSWRQQASRLTCSLMTCARD
jgi:hypothetical protein